MWESGGYIPRVGHLLPPPVSLSGSEKEGYSRDAEKEGFPLVYRQNGFYSERFLDIPGFFTFLKTPDLSRLNPSELLIIPP